MLKFFYLLIAFFSYAQASLNIDDEHKQYNTMKWISENPLLFDYIALSIIIIIILLIYAQYINKSLSKEKKNLEDILQEYEEQKLALDAFAIVSITNVKGDIIYVNEKFTQISGFSKEELIGNKHKIVNSGQHDSQFWKNMHATISQGKTWKDHNICNLKKDGTYYWVDTLIYPIIKDNKPQHYVAIRIDVTESKEIEKELEVLYEEAQTTMREKEALMKEVEILAYNDALTNIPNRLSLMKSFESTLASAQRNQLQLNVMFLDLDGFKLINDTLDHDTGDRVLIEVANILKSTLRKDDLYGRIGGDEFVIITTESCNASQESPNSKIVCQKLLKDINAIQLPESVKESFGASIGVISTTPSQVTSTELLLKEADKLMYEVKKKDKNNFIIKKL